MATQKYKHQTWQVYCNDLTPSPLSQGEGGSGFEIILYIRFFKKSTNYSQKV